MEKRKKNIKIIIFSVVVVLVALGGLVPAFLLNYNTFSPEKPIILDDGMNFYIKTSYNDNYAGYRFKFKDALNNEIIMDTDKNVLDVDSIVENGIKIGQTYKISTCYLGKNPGNDSEFSEETEWKCQVYLSATVLIYDQSNNKLTWNEVDNADYYRVFYNDSNEDVYKQTEMTELSLEGFDFGQKSMYIKAYSNNQNYKTCDKVELLNFDLIHYFSEFENPVFDKNQKVLTVENTELLTEIIIKLDDKSYTSNKFEVIKNGEIYTYKIDLTTIYNDETLISIYPSDIDEYHIFNGDYATIDLSE